MRKLSIRERLAAVCACLLVAPVTMAETLQPRWEAGVGLATFFHPDYLGADQARALVLPSPYLVYRGDYIRADRGGLRGEIYDSERLDLRLSLGGALPVNSDDNDARAGMDDLGIVLELGPTLQYTLMERNDVMLRFDWPVRAALSFLDEGFAYHEGWTTQPRFYYANDIGRWTLHSTLGPEFRDRRYHGYYYEVGPDDVLADRPAYEASAGYTGMKFTLGVRRRIDNIYLNLGMSAYDLSGASNDDSPLLLQDHYLGFNVFVAWIAKESRKRVQQPDVER